MATRRFKARRGGKPMTKLLELTDDEFEVLHELVSDTINEMDTSDLEAAGMPLSEYEIFHVFKKLEWLEAK